MTTQIAPGDIVLRDGRAEEVLNVYSPMSGYERQVGKYSVVIPGPYHKLSDAIRIGSTKDGWRIHTGSERPAGVGPDDELVVWTRGMTYGPPQGPAEAKDWDWGEDNGGTIVAYRLAAPAPRTLTPGHTDSAGNTWNGEYVVAGKVSETDAALDKLGRDVQADWYRDREAELRAVAEEMRAAYRAMPNIAFVLDHWADRIDSSREPEPLKVGDRVRLRHGRISTPGGLVIAGLDGPWVVLNVAAFRVKPDELERDL